MAQRFATYRFQDGDTLLNAEVFNSIWRDIDGRLNSLESAKQAFDTLIGDLRLSGISRLTSALQESLPDILADAQTGYLTGLADHSIPWQKILFEAATAADFGAEPEGSVVVHESTPGIHEIEDVAGLQTILSGKQDASALLDSIAEEVPLDGGVVIGNGTAFGVEVLEAGDSIAFVRSGGVLRINATGSAAGEVNTGANIGTGVGLFASKSGALIQLKSLKSSHSALALSATSNEVTLSLNESQLSVPISSVSNLQAELNGKQPIHALLTDYTALTPTDNALLRGTGTGAEWVSLVAGSNITITQDAGDITIAASATGETNTAANVGAGTGFFKQKSGVQLQFKTLVSQSNALVVASTTDLVQLDLNIANIAAAFGANAIGWSQVSKSGASPDDIGAEVAGTAAAHAAADNAHAIAGVSGLQAALDARLQLAASSTQTLDTSIAIQHATLTGQNITPNVGQDNYFLIGPLTANTTINAPTSLPTGKMQVITYLIDMGSTAGRTLTWNSIYKWGDAGTPTWKNTANAINLVTFLHYSGSLYYMGHRSY